MLKWILIITALGLALGLAWYVNSRPKLILVSDAINIPALAHYQHQEFESLLRLYVDDKGGVNYQAWSENEQSLKALDAYILQIQNYSPESHQQLFDKSTDKLVYWLNTYNALVIKAVLHHWPLESVTEVKAPVEIVRGFGFFATQKFLVGGKLYSLYEIENHKIRRSFDEPRIHFVLNCASGSCPAMIPDLPRGDDLEIYLSKAAESFVSRNKHVRIDRENQIVWLSKIFDWYTEDFTAQISDPELTEEQRLIEYISGIAPRELKTDLKSTKNYRIKFMDYDWQLNKPGYNSGE